jgi:hypothetical protein
MPGIYLHLPHWQAEISLGPERRGPDWYESFEMDPRPGPGWYVQKVVPDPDKIPT